MADDATPPAAAPTSAKNMPSSKNEAVLWAVRSLGRDAKPGDIQGFVKQEYGLDMTIAHIYTAKSQAVKSLKGKGGRPKGSTKAAPAAPAPTPPSRPPSLPPVVASGGITLEDIRAVKALTDRIGAEKVRQLAAVLAR